MAELNVIVDVAVSVELAALDVVGEVPAVKLEKLALPNSNDN